MTPDANFESISYNPFIVTENFLNSESDPDINFYSIVYRNTWLGNTNLIFVIQQIC